MANVILMNSETWENIKEIIVNKVIKGEEPIGYLDRLNEMEIIIDEDIPTGHVEIYDKEIYEMIEEKGKGVVDEE